MKLFAVSSFLLIAAASFGQTTSLFSRTDIYEDDHVAWSQLNSGYYNAPGYVNTTSGYVVGVDSQWTNMLHRGLSSYSPTPAGVNDEWVFGAGVNYIDNFHGSALRFDFAHSVYAVGMRMGSDVLTPDDPSTSDPIGFNFHLFAYADGGTLLGQTDSFLTVHPDSVNAAPFLGISSTTPIGYIILTMDDIYYGRSNNELKLAVDDLSLRNSPTAVPEPMSMLGLATGLGVFMRRRRR